MNIYIFSIELNVKVFHTVNKIVAFDVGGHNYEYSSVPRIYAKHFIQHNKQLLLNYFALF